MMQVQEQLFGKKHMKLCLPSDVCEVEKMFDSGIADRD